MSSEFLSKTDILTQTHTAPIRDGHGGDRTHSHQVQTFHQTQTIPRGIHRQSLPRVLVKILPGGCALHVETGKPRSPHASRLGVELRWYSSRLVCVTGPLPMVMFTMTSVSVSADCRLVSERLGRVRCRPVEHFHVDPVNHFRVSGGKAYRGAPQGT